MNFTIDREPWTYKNWVHGPGFVAWLAEEVPRNRDDIANNRDNLSHVRDMTGENLGRRIYTYRQGGHAHFAAVDRIVSACNLHLQDIPADLWTDSPEFGINKGISTETAVRMWNEGRSVREIADALGCTTRAIHYHLKKADCR